MDIVQRKTLIGLLQTRNYVKDPIKILDGKWNSISLNLSEKNGNCSLE
jgi:hypothetical protein